MYGPLAGGCRQMYALLESWFAMPEHSSHFYPARDADAGLREDRHRFLESAEISLGLPSLFYGSLRHPRVFETVTGRTLDSCRRERTTIRGFRLGLANAGTGFPGLFPADGPGAPELECLLVHDLTRFEQAMARLKKG